MNNKYILMATIFLLAGCATVDRMWNPPTMTDKVSSIAGEVQSAGGGLAMLSFVGGISILGGIVLLCVSTGRKGWYPVLGGVGLIFINALLQEYFHLIALPIIVASGVVSTLWAFKALGQARIVKLKKEHCNG